MKTKIIISLIVLLLVSTSLWKIKKQAFKPKINQNAQIEKLADIVVKKCLQQKNNFTCYEAEIPKLMDRISMEEAFEVTKIVQEKDATYTYCHVLAHKISFTESKKNPNDWKKILTRCPFSMCNYGCLHGSLIQHYRGEVLSDSQLQDAVVELKDVCEQTNLRNSTDMDRMMCYHAIGHLAMYITGADIKKSLSVCKAVGRRENAKDYYPGCMEGIFMTIIYGGDPEDLALTKKIRPTKKTVDAFCRQFVGMEYEACKRESSSLFEDELYIPQKLVEFCSFSKDQQSKNSCYTTVINRLTDNILPKKNWLDIINNYCDAFPDSHYDDCFGMFADRIIQTDKAFIDKAIAVCEKALNPVHKNSCYYALAYYAESIFSNNSVEKKNYCVKLIPPYDKLCSEIKPI